MTTTWYLRKLDGTVYGPVALEELSHWASDGRIEPTDSVSSDQVNWLDVSQQSELEMDWTIQLPEGEVYGPVHRMYLAELILEGDIPPEISVRNVRSDDTSTACMVALKALARRPAAESELKEELDQMKADHALVIQDASALQARLESRVAELEESESRLRQQLDEQATGMLAQEAVENELKEMKSRLEVKESELRLLRAEVEALEAKYNEAQRVKDELQRELEARQNDLHSASEKLTASEQSAQQMMADKENEIASVRAELMTQIEKLESRTGELVEQLAEAREQASVSRASATDGGDSAQAEWAQKEEAWQRQRAELEKQIRGLREQLALHSAHMSPSAQAAESKSIPAADANPLARAALTRMRSQTKLGAVDHAPESILRRAAVANKQDRKPPKPKKRNRFPVPGRSPAKMGSAAR